MVVSSVMFLKGFNDPERVFSQPRGDSVYVRQGEVFEPERSRSYCENLSSLYTFTPRSDATVTLAVSYLLRPRHSRFLASSTDNGICVVTFGLSSRCSPV